MTNKYNWIKYKGDWKNRSCHGYGNRIKIDCYFKNFSMLSLGKCYWSDGKRYVGEWRDGKIEGRGKR